MDDVKKAFLSLSRKVHPDKNPEHIDLATRAFQRLQVLKAAIEDALVQPWAQPTPTADREASSAEQRRAQAVHCGAGCPAAFTHNGFRGDLGAHECA